MEYKEYAQENKETVNLEDLEVGFISKKNFTTIHKESLLVCADVLIKYQGGFLLVKRENVPASGEYWAIGGRLLKGVSSEKSIKDKAKSECNLELKNLKLLNMGRTYFKTDPFGHGKGTDTVNFMYLAEGVGNIKLDNLHSNPLILTPELFEKMKSSLHPYMLDFIEMAFANNSD
ncbi:hypothetical protein J4416_03385 [Candidatus Pacearchaeota archaeon]|nr:hypothetical protein [Candidatus Pacearchaeota archaeon]